MGSEEHVSLRIPSPIKYISPTEVVQLDNVEECTLFNDKHQLTDPPAKVILS